MREVLNKSSSSRNAGQSTVNLPSRRKHHSELTASRLKLKKAVQLAILRSRSTRSPNTKSASLRRKDLRRREQSRDSISTHDTFSAHQSRAQKSSITSIALGITRTSMRAKNPA